MPIDHAFMDLAAKCAPQIHVETLAAVVSVQSAFNPLMVRIADREPAATGSAGEAVAVAVEAIDGGQRVAMGLGGLNEAALRSQGLGLVDAFDECASLGAVAKILGTNGSLGILRFLKAMSVAGDHVTFARRVEEVRGALGPKIRTLVAERARATAVAERPAETQADKSAAFVTARVSPAWDVFGQGRAAGVMVFSKPSKGEK